MDPRLRGDKKDTGFPPSWEKRKPFPREDGGPSRIFLLSFRVSEANRENFPNPKRKERSLHLVPSEWYFGRDNREGERSLDSHSTSLRAGPVELIRHSTGQV